MSEYPLPTMRPEWQAVSHVIDATTDLNGDAIFECPHKGYGKEPSYWFGPNTEFLIREIRTHTELFEDFSLFLYIGSAPYVLCLPNVLCEHEWHSIKEAPLRIVPHQNFSVTTNPSKAYVRVFLKGLLYRRTQ